MRRLDEDVKINNVYKTAALLPSVVSTPLSRQHQPPPVAPPSPFRSPDSPGETNLPSCFFTSSQPFHPSSSFSFFQPTTSADVAEDRTDAIQALLAKYFGDHVASTDFHKDLSLAVSSVFSFFLKTTLTPLVPVSSPEFDFETPLFVLSSLRELTDESMFVEIMQKLDVLLKSLGSVQQLEQGYRKVSDDLTTTERTFEGVRAAFRFYLEESSISFTRYKNLCLVQEVMERVRKVDSLLTEGKSAATVDPIGAYGVIEKALVLLDGLNDVECAKQLAVDAAAAKEDVVRRITEKKRVVNDVFEAVDLSPARAYPFEEGEWMNDFESERAEFVAVVAGFVRIRNVTGLLKSVRNFLARYVMFFPLLTLGGGHEPKTGERDVESGVKMQLQQHVERMNFNEFTNYLGNFFNKAVHISCLAVIFSMVLELELENSSDEERESHRRELEKMMSQFRGSVVSAFKFVVENGNYSKVALCEVVDFSSRVKRFLHQLHVIFKKKMTSVEKIHEKYMGKFFDLMSQSDAAKINQHVVLYDDLNVQEIDNESYETIEFIVRSIVIPPMECRMGEPNEENQVMYFLIDGDPYFVTTSLHMILITIRKYREVAMAFPVIAGTVVERTRDLFMQYNTNIRKLRMEKGTKRKMGVKKMTIAMQTLLVLSLLCPYVHRYLSPHVVVSGKMMENAEEKMRAQCDEIRLYLTTIFKTRVTFYLENLERTVLSSHASPLPPQHTPQKERKGFMFKSSKSPAVPQQQPPQIQAKSSKELAELLLNIKTEIINLNDVLRANLRKIDFKYCVFEQSRHLNMLREEFEAKTTNDELKNRISADLHTISVALHERLVTTDDPEPPTMTSLETPRFLSKFEVEDDESPSPARPAAAPEPPAELPAVARKSIDNGSLSRRHANPLD